MGRDLKISQERGDLLLELKISLAKQLFSRAIPKEKIRVLMDFMKYYVRFENHDINVKFEQEVEILTERNITMGIEELLLDRAEQKGLKKGLKKGIEEKGHNVVVNRITELGLSDEEVARIAEVSIDFVKKIRSKLKK
jgi:hypothetical protein